MMHDDFVLVLSQEFLSGLKKPKPMILTLKSFEWTAEELPNPR